MSYIEIQPKDDQGEVTNHVLRVIREAESRNPAPEPEEPDEEVQIDERWLVSYADKMTLLCGMFIMLFAMSTLDKVRFQKVKESAEKSFGKPTTEIDPKKEYVEVRELTKVKDQEQALRQQIQALETKLSQSEQEREEARETIATLETKAREGEARSAALESKSRELEERLKIAERATTDVTTQAKMIEKLETELRQAKLTATEAEERRIQLQDQVTRLQRERPDPNAAAVQSALEERVRKLEARNRELEKQVKEKPKPKPTEKPVPTADPKQLARLEREKEQLERRESTLSQNVETLQREVREATETIRSLTQQLAAAQAAIPTSSFIAFVMTWATDAHDVDLSVEDPAGRAFDFKKRKHKDHPGLLVLDTRRGPGTEVWQADKIIPGDYRFKYHFYNPYGNKKPCEVKGSLFTTKGQIDFPVVKLTPSSKDASFTISIDKDGVATLRR